MKYRYGINAGMKLAKYLSDHGILQQDFAALIGKSQVNVSRYASGSRKPDSETIAKIHTATGGKVSLADWHPELARAIRKTVRQERAAV